MWDCRFEIKFEKVISPGQRYFPPENRLVWGAMAGIIRRLALLLIAFARLSGGLCLEQQVGLVGEPLRGLSKQK